jgi:Zn-dependent peptidase ImmA (M78 family)
MNAKETLERHWDGKTLPVPVVRIANAMGARVVSSRNMEDSGWVERVGEEFKIAVREDDPPHRKRFTIAHEIGHIALGHLREGLTLFRDRDFNRPRDYRERAANRFAAEILMPAQYIDLAWGRIPFRQIASCFGVSNQTLLYRLERLGIIDVP